MKLTDSIIRAAKPRDKRYNLPDGKGLVLFVEPSGSKFWRFRYKFLGKENTLSLGTYPVVKLSEARQKHAKLKELLARGVDPSVQRKTERQQANSAAQNSFHAIALEWHKKQSHTWVASHSRDVLRRLEINAFPFIGGLPIDTIDAPKLLSMCRVIEQRGAYDLAHRVLGVCGQVFRFGIASGRCTRDPSADLRGALTPHVKKHQAAVKPEEVAELIRAISTYDQIGTRQTQLALELMTLTFLRTKELRGAEWAEIDVNNSVWIVPSDRMKKKRHEHLVPLAPQALKILSELKTIGGDSRFIFPGRNPDKSISENTILFALYRLGYKGKMTGHGFRTVASTIMNESGLFNPDAIERQLAHADENEVRAAYNRGQYLDERKKLMFWWADFVDELRRKYR